MGIDSVLIVIGIAAFLVFHYFFRAGSDPEKQIWQIISKDRICHHAGIDANDIKLAVTSFNEVNAKGQLPAQKQYNFQISCALRKAESKKKTWVVVGNGYSVNLTSDAKLVEDQIADDIRNCLANQGVRDRT